MNNKKFTVFASLLVYVLFVGLAISVFLADYYATLAKDQLYSGNIGRADIYIKRAINLNRFEPVYHRLKATNLIASSISESVSSDERDLSLELALAELKISYSLQPDNVVNIKSLVPLYFFLWADQLPSANHDKYKAEAIEFYDEVYDISPNDASIYLTLGKYYRQFGEKEKAGVALTKAFDLKPDSLIILQEIEKLKTESL